MRFFVYGTLKPGHERFPVIEPFVTRVERAHTPGALFNLGPYPAARFSNIDEGLIPGYLLWTVDEDHVLQSLDTIEGHPHLFVRRGIVVNVDGRTSPAYGYEFVNAAHLSDTARIDEWYPERDAIPLEDEV